MGNRNISSAFNPVGDTFVFSRTRLFVNTEGKEHMIYFGFAFKDLVSHTRPDTTLPSTSPPVTVDLNSDGKLIGLRYNFGPVH